MVDKGLDSPADVAGDKEVLEEEEGDSTQAVDTAGLIAKAQEAAERLEAGNKRTAELLAQMESLNLSKKLGGHAEAGSSKRVSAEEKAILEASKLLEGTGYDDILKPKEK